MKRSILFLSILLSAGITLSQSTEIYVGQFNSCIYTGQVNSIDLPTHNFAGEIVEVSYTGPSNTTVELIFTNTSNSTIDWLISRRRIGVDPIWTDFLVWGHADEVFGGVAVDANYMDQDVWTAPDIISFIVTAEPGESALAVSHIIPDLTATGCGTYRYYVGTAADPFQDSVDLQLCHTLGLEEESGFNLSISPNPASDHFEISSESSLELNYSIANSLGQIIDSGSFIKNHPVETSGFENGVYFVTMANGAFGLKTERIIINH